MRPFSVRFIGQQGLTLESLRQGELQSAFADKHDVWSFLHHAPRDRDGVLDVLQKCDRTTVAFLIHDAGIERHTTLAIGESAVADAGNMRIGFTDPHACFDRIEGPPTAGKHLPSSPVGRQTVLPG